MKDLCKLMQIAERSVPGHTLHYNHKTGQPAETSAFHGDALSCLITHMVVANYDPKLTVQENIEAIAKIFEELTEGLENFTVCLSAMVAKDFENET